MQGERGDIVPDVVARDFEQDRVFVSAVLLCNLRFKRRRAEGGPRQDLPHVVVVRVEQYLVAADASVHSPPADLRELAEAGKQ